MAKIFTQKLKILPKSEMRATCYCKSGSAKKKIKMKEQKKRDEKERHSADSLFTGQWF